MKHILNFHIIIIALAAVLIAACSTGKSVTGSGKPSSSQGHAASSGTSELAQLSFVQKVSDNSIYAINITGDLTLTVKAGSKEVSLPGSLHMRRNKVIRLQAFIPILGTEVGRIEFAPDYVLLVDRIHKEYVKADYSQVNFLKNNGLSFYLLQSLFWNELLVPGKEEVSESDLKKFLVDLNVNSDDIPVTLVNKNMKFEWKADKSDALINSATVTYTSSAHGTSTLDWRYSDFRSVGARRFPASQIFSFNTSASGKQRQASLQFEMNKIDTDDNWDATTTVSSKYKEVKPEEILGKIMKLQ